MKEMRAVLKKLQKDPCRDRPLSDNDKESFSAYTHIQRYYPALDIFAIPDMSLSKKNMELPTTYFINQWLEQDKEQPRRWQALRKKMDSNETESCEVFNKVVHLLNPIDMIKEKYVCPEHPLLPQSEKTWKNTCG